MSSDINYFETIFGKALLSAHSVDEYGTWFVEGESDKNIGNKPFIGVFKGTLAEVVSYASTYKNFYNSRAFRTNNRPGPFIMKIGIVTLS